LRGGWRRSSSRRLAPTLLGVCSSRIEDALSETKEMEREISDALEEEEEGAP
jgi:hypothetical protein